MKSGKKGKQKQEKDYRIILTRPETIFNDFTVKIVAKKKNTTCTLVRKVMKGLLAVREHFAADRRGLFGRLIDTWRYAAANVGGLADMIMQTPGGIDVDDKYVESVISPYAIYNNFVTGALIGEMTSAEELELTITSNILASNWSKLLSIIESRGCSDAETIEKVEIFTTFLNKHLVEIYQSCEKPVVDAQWIVAYDSLETLLNKMLNDLSSYDPMKNGMFAQ